VHAPMAPDAATADEMVAVCERAGVRLGVVVPQQADPVLEQIRQMIADDWLGGPVLVEGLIGDDTVLRSPPPPEHWLRDPQKSGAGALLQLAAPHVHMATWLTGRAALRVTAQASSGFSALPEDAAVGTAVLRGGAVCTFAASHLTRGAAFVYGTDGGVRLATDRIWLRGQHEFSGAVFEYLEPGDEATLSRADIQEAIADTGRDAELHGRFARWLDDLDDFPCPGDQGAQDMKLIDAWRRAAQSGRTETV
jgi:predicted dehydrogenase